MPSISHKHQGILRQPSFLRTFQALRLRLVSFLFLTLPLTPFIRAHLVEEANDLAGDVLAPSLFVVHDAGGGGQNNVAELTGGQELVDPLLHVAELDVVARADDAGFVQTVSPKNPLAFFCAISLKKKNRHGKVAITVHSAG